MVIVRRIEKLNAALQNSGHSLAPGLAFICLFVCLFYFVLGEEDIIDSSSLSC